MIKLDYFSYTKAEMNEPYFDKNLAWFKAFDKGAEVDYYKEDFIDYSLLVIENEDGTDNAMPLPVFLKWCGIT